MSERDEAALRRLIEDARSDGPPSMDYAKIEASLLERVAATPRVVRRPRSWAPVALAAAAVTLAAAVFVMRTHRAPTASVPPASVSAPSLSSEVNGDSLAVGAIVSASDGPVTVVHRDHVTWELASNGRARLDSTGDVVSLALLEGAISAHVTKSPKPESFAIVVEHTRVAVHGTRFRVERLERTVHVELSEGVVAVGPVGGPSFELFAPATAVLSFEGAREDGAPASVVPKRAPAVEAEPADTGVKSQGGTKVDAAAKDAHIQEAMAPGVDRVIGSVRQCLAANTVAGDGLKVSVRTKMSLRVLASGHVSEASFDPPLSPRVQSCVEAALGPIEFSTSAGGYALDRVIELAR